MFRFDEALPVLGRTPGTLRALLQDLPAAWTGATEGPNTWSPFDVVGHLIHGERTNWVPRVEHILRHGDAVPFPAFDREAMFTASTGRSLGELLDTFDRLRTESLARLVELALTDADLARRGLHPQFGIVTLDQHLATWVAHDLTHISQVVRVMARQYTDTVGPWREYLSILGRAQGKHRPFVPEGWPSVVPRIFAAEPRQLVDFVKLVFDAAGDYQDDRPSVLLIGGSVIMISDAEARGPTSAFLYVYVEDADATYQRALDAGARSLEPPSDMPYGDRRGMVEDKWGNTWQIATNRARS